MKSDDNTVELSYEPFYLNICLHGNIVSTKHANTLVLFYCIPSFWSVFEQL